MLYFPLADNKHADEIYFQVTNISHETTVTTDHDFETVLFTAVRFTGDKTEYLDFDGIRIFWGAYESTVVDELGNTKIVSHNADANYKGIKIASLYEGELHKFNTVRRADRWFFNQEEIVINEITCLVFKDEIPIKVAAEILFYKGYFPIDDNGKVFKG